MKRFGLEPWPVGKRVEFPYDPHKLEELAAQGDEEEVVVDERNYVQGGSRYCIYGAYQITVLRHAGP